MARKKLVTRRIRLVGKLWDMIPVLIDTEMPANEVHIVSPHGVRHRIVNVGPSKRLGDKDG